MATMSSDMVEVDDPEAGEKFLVHIDRTVNNVFAHNAWAQLKAAEVSEAELEQVVQSEGLESDKQTHIFRKFLSMATNFSSTNFNDRLNSVPKVVQSIADLLDAMRKEVQEYAEFANQFQELVAMYGKLVIDTQHQMGLLLPYMSAAKDHLSVLADVFESNVNTLTTTDQDDIKIAMNGLAKGMQQMINVSHSSGQESRQLNERITKLKTNVQKKRGTVHGRISLSKALSYLGPLAGASIVARVVGTLVAMKELGGAGMLVVAGFSLNPIVAIICGALLGGTLIITIASLVYRFWTRHQYKALAFLEKICSGLMELAQANMFFLDYLNKSEEAANTINIQLDQVQNSLTSERYRKQNAKVCKKALETLEQAVQVIESIRNINITRWLDPQSIPHFAIHSLVLPVTMS
ncbi:unnamed protein product [Rotaria magnacalcarata]|uniref:Uncharacterized protein n=1 Tax=Rotaria magnacalcarata TaxID=392030 RepID=A0A815XCG1_9BILA|nr:unnamed protein product [Rotaria magnacalcarata]CAF1555769.1 unnamed protein product [Rotaria magnacalcarata]CAF2122385.1 unnamed protein product [Rotaria magnacalcarata]CAF3879532.1 unnamed protein product [Rotaria magnacalcarata]CAF3883017.1 unnamed protein product [Rotaria magnacalcarata]